MTNEKIYLEDKNLYVSSSLIKTDSFTFQVKNIASYRAVRGGGTIYTMAPFIIGLAVLALSYPGQNVIGMGFGVALITLGLYLVFAIKSLYLITSAEQVRAYTTLNNAKMDALISAVDQAMRDNNR